MLSISAETRAALLEDSIGKEWRIHFPNGESADIGNNKIAEGSVKFTESICSGADLVFGLCESSVFEADVICPQNIKGATIEVAVFVNDEEIKIGTFIVNECTLSDSIAGMRSLLAYDFTAENDFEINDVSKRILTSAFSYDNTPLQVGIDNIVKMSVTPTAYATAIADTGHEETRRVIIGSTRGYDLAAYMRKIPMVDRTCLMCIQQQFSDEFAESANALLDSWVSTYGGVKPRIYAQFVSAAYRAGSNAGSVFARTRTTFDLCSISTQTIMIPCIYSTATVNNVVYTIKGGCRGISPMLTTEQFPLWEQIYKLEIINADTRAVIASTSGDSGLSVTEYELAGDFPVEFPAVEAGADPLSNKPIFRHAIGEQHGIDILRSYCELSGRMGRYNRNGDFEIVPISQKVAAVIDETHARKTDYMESITLPFGRVRMAYKNTAGEDRVAERYLNGFTETDVDGEDYQTYDLSDNWIVKEYTLDDQHAKEMLLTIARSIAGAQYMPAVATINGRPDIEAGDMVAIKTKMGYIKALVMRRTMTGGQTLVDQVNSNANKTKVAELPTDVFEINKGRLNVNGLI